MRSTPGRVDIDRDAPRRNERLAYASASSPPAGWVSSRATAARPVPTGFGGYRPGHQRMLERRRKRVALLEGVVEAPVARGCGLERLDGLVRCGQSGSTRPRSGVEDRLFVPGSSDARRGGAPSRSSVAASRCAPAAEARSPAGRRELEHGACVAGRRGVMSETGQVEAAPRAAKRSAASARRWSSSRLLRLDRFLDRQPRQLVTELEPVAAVRQRPSMPALDDSDDVLAEISSSNGSTRSAAIAIASSTLGRPHSDEPARSTASTIVLESRRFGARTSAEERLSAVLKLSSSASSRQARRALRRPTARAVERPRARPPISSRSRPARREAGGRGRARHPGTSRARGYALARPCARAVAAHRASPRRPSAGLRARARSADCEPGRSAIRRSRTRWLREPPPARVRRRPPGRYPRLARAGAASRAGRTHPEDAGWRVRAEVAHQGRLAGSSLARDEDQAAGARAGDLQPSPEGFEELPALEQRLLLADRPQLDRAHVDSCHDGSNRLRRTKPKSPPQAAAPSQLGGTFTIPHTAPTVND